MKLDRLRIISQNSYAPYMNAGTRHFGMGRVMVADGINVQIITSSFNHKTLQETRKFKWFEFYQKEDIEGVEFIWIKTLSYPSHDGIARVSSMFLFGITVLILCLFNPRFKKPDLIIGSSPTLIPAFFASIISRVQGVPFVFEIRDLWPQTIVDFHPEKKGHFLIKLFYWIEKKCLKRAALIAGLLPGIPIYLDQINKDLAKKFLWLPNGVDTENIGDALTPRKRTNRVVYAGSLSKANAMESIMKVIERCPEFEFYIYGSGINKASLEQIAEIRGLNNCHFMGHVPKNDIYEVLNSADILIATLKDTDLYRFGISLNKLYDYLAVGKPVVFGAKAFNDPVSEANAGITVQPENDEEMALAIRKIAALPDAEYEQLGRNGQKYILQNHTFSILSGKLLKEIKKL